MIQLINNLNLDKEKNSKNNEFNPNKNLKKKNNT